MDVMDPQSIGKTVGDHGFAVISLASEDRAYAIPIFYGYDGLKFYFQSKPGQKEQFIRTTKEACLTILQATSADNWATVQVFGEIHRITREREQFEATQALMKLPYPPEFGLLRDGRPARSATDLFLWALRPSRTTGRFSATALPTFDNLLSIRDVSNPVERGAAYKS